jgi:hypothetical protein
MPIKPNFTDVVLTGGFVKVNGLSEASDVAGFDIIDIQVVLAQGNRIARGGVGKIVTEWQANLPVSDDAGLAPDFQPGAAVAFGVETHRENLATVTWAQPVQIAQL